MSEKVIRGTKYTITNDEFGEPNIYTRHDEESDMTISLQFSRESHGVSDRIISKLSDLFIDDYLGFDR